MKKKPIAMPKFTNEGEEADWWASRQGREFVKQNATGPTKKRVAPKGSRLVGQLNRTASVQIALRLPEPDVKKAREIAARKGVGYQTLLSVTGRDLLRLPRLISSRLPPEFPALFPLSRSSQSGPRRQGFASPRPLGAPLTAPGRFGASS